MRIIAGEFRGRKLKTPETHDIRPTTDRLRESIFSVALHRKGTFEGLEVADVFAGTGAFGLESLSRGAAKAVFVERDEASLKLLTENISLLKVAARAEVLKLDAVAVPPRTKAPGIIFMDPPYGKGLVSPVLGRLFAKGWIGPATLVVVEREEKDDFGIPEGMEEVRVLKQGKRRAHFLEMN